MTTKFCPKCGTALSAGAKFCPGCGQRVSESAPEGKGSLQKTAEAIQTVTSTISKVESATQSAKTVARTARDLSTITLRPPAQWKVVVGEVLPVAGRKAVDAAVSTAGQKVEQTVTEEVSRVITEHMGGAARTPVPESFVPEKGVPGEAGGVPCPSCGTRVSPGTRFCGSCGAKIEGSMTPFPATPPSPLCPACGKAIIPGKKFCGSCGAKIEEITKPASAPPPQPVCPACGKPVMPGKKFCGSCGHRVA